MDKLTLAHPQEWAVPARTRTHRESSSVIGIPVYGHCASPQAEVSQASNIVQHLYYLPPFTPLALMLLLLAQQAAKLSPVGVKWNGH